MTLSAERLAKLAELINGTNAVSTEAAAFSTEPQAKPDSTVVRSPIPVEPEPVVEITPPPAEEPTPTKPPVPAARIGATNKASYKSVAERAYETLLQFPTTELGNAVMLAHAYRKRMCYDANLKVWLYQTPSGLWQPDHTQVYITRAAREANLSRRDWALKIPKDYPDKNYMAARDQHLSWSYASEGLRVFTNTLGWAQRMPEFHIDPSLWDRDKFTIGTPAGVYSLRTGKLLPPEAHSYVSKTTSAAPADTADCPIWESFLLAVMQGDLEKVAYLKRLAGCVLTGDVSDHVLIWFIGQGGNGKGTYLETLFIVYGGYAHAMRIEPLLATKYDLHPTEICDLKGRRLVIASESQEDRMLNEAQIKRLSGGDTITARRIRQDSITFQPTHKLVISCNNEPKLPGVDQSERRRFQLLRWEASFKSINDPDFQEADLPKDKDLPDKLRAEYPQILRWSMDGAREYMEQGLNPPESILLSSKESMDAQDTKGRWMDECLTLDPTWFSLSVDLFHSWQSWARERGYEHIGDSAGLSRKIRNRFKGLVSSDRESGSRGITGIKLKSTEEPFGDETKSPITLQ